MLKKVLLTLSISLLVNNQADAKEFLAYTEMNGISYAKYKGFEKKWKLITVRFRKDTEEMRFTYANKLAQKTLLAGKTDYPDGAVFGKVGVKTVADSLFESSVVPAGARRYQLMVRDKKKYKDHAGWGYALFDEKGVTFPEDLKDQVNACASCHEAASERGYVFSQELSLDQAKKNILPLPTNIQFKNVDRKDLPEIVTAHLPANFKQVRQIEGSLTSNLFQGSLEEIRPLLYKETKNSQLPSILLSEDRERFSLVIPVEIGVECTSGPKTGIYLKSILTNIMKQNILELDLCYAP